MGLFDDLIVKRALSEFGIHALQDGVCGQGDHQGNRYGRDNACQYCGLEFHWILT